MNPAPALTVEVRPDSVVARPAWRSDESYPRSNPPAFSGEQLKLADALARLALDASPGELVRTQNGAEYVYRRPDEAGVRV